MPVILIRGDEMMKAVVVSSKGIDYSDISDPQMGSHDLLIEVRACGICGSDIPRVFSSSAHHYPLILGHEISGIIR